MSNNKGAKIVAFISLFMIVFSVFGTGILYLYEANKNSSGNNLSESQLNELLKGFSGSNIGTGGIELKSKSNIGTGGIELKSNESGSGLDITNLTKTGVIDK